MAAFRPAEQRGLRVLGCGKRRYVTGREVIRFLEAQQDDALPKPLKVNFWRQVKQEEKHMPLMTTRERIGREEGLIEGLAKGLSHRLQKVCQLGRLGTRTHYRCVKIRCKGCNESPRRYVSIATYLDIPLIGAIVYVVGRLEEGPIADRSDKRRHRKKELISRGSLPMEKAYVEVRDGGYWVNGARVSLDSVVLAFVQGLAPETIVGECFPTLTLEQVYGATPTTLRIERRSTRI